MTPREIIRRKRNGEALTSEEIRYFVRGFMDSQIADYHASALLMAICFRGMTLGETIALTREIRESGTVLDLSSIPGRKVDKHSTGGVGDKTSLMLAPIVAACGVTVPMITGRALGHTGGTLDKLQSIPGFDPYPSTKRIPQLLRKNGAVIMGQTEELAPADRRLYALRDVTATVESIPLITASILSKKTAEGIDGLVMDVKTGSGSFTPCLKESAVLARSLVDVCRTMKTRIAVLITDMEQPLGRAVGNSIEVRECIDFLNGNGPPDLETLTLALAAHMIVLGGRAKTITEGSRMAYRAVASGEAADRFRAIIRAQGGDERVVDQPALLPIAKNIREIRAGASGFLSRCDARLLGLAANALGAGRARVEDSVDAGVGLYLEKKLGDRVKRGEILCRLFWNDEGRLAAAMPLVSEALAISKRAMSPPPLIHAVLE
jgi:pyrimidine-nucleoside phosphorylase/thymidine phosphorylase